MIVLIAVGLYASLIPRLTYASASSGEPSGQVLVVWPGWGVQQELGSLDGAVERFQIWISAEPDRGVATVLASLVDAATNEVMRQTTIQAAPAYVPVQRTVTFPSYGVPDGQRLALQLRVATFETRYVIFGLAHRQSAYERVSLNGTPDAGSGPLAFAHVQTGNGLRAAILGEPFGRMRLALAISLSVLAAVLHPRAVASLRNVLSEWSRTVRRIVHRFGRLAGSRIQFNDANADTTIDGILLLPWYPWLAAVVPIIHFLTNNRLHFSAADAIVPLGFVMLLVAGSMGSLRLLLRDWHQAAAATTVVTALFFAYGHIDYILGDRIDQRALFAVTVTLGVLMIVKIVQSGSRLIQRTKFLNVATAILVVFPLAMLINQALFLGRTSASDPVEEREIVAHLFPDLPVAAGNTRPDIYYIILDSYGRYDEIGDFDNSAFLRELEDRGFYVADEATSNYEYSIQSISATFNMSYLDGLGKRAPDTEKAMLRAGRYNAVATVLRRLGYTYVHFESGTLITDEAPLADIRVRFTGAGTIVDASGRSQSDRSASEDFVRALVSTTALRPLVGGRFLLSDEDPLAWFAPERTLQMFDALENPIKVGGPKFVFAHILKPHRPATFDRFGNYVSGTTLDVFGTKAHDEFGPQHDPSVADAYIGQLIYINSLVLEAVDQILQKSEHDPIIVIAGDHGRGEGFSRHAILAAFRLPHGGNVGLYPSISSVNHFRYILGYFFDLDIELIDDLNIAHDATDYNFASSATNFGN